MVWSVTPPHSENIGPCEAFCDGPGEEGALGELEPELSEHAANTGIMAAAARASAFAERRCLLAPPSRLGKPVARLLRVTPCTVAAAQHLNHRHTN
jgi:hypothetical protein